MPFSDIRECSECGLETVDWYGQCGDYHCCPNLTFCGECRDERFGDDDVDYLSSLSSRGRIRSYSYRPPRWSPKGDYRNNPLLGLELEVGRSADVIADVVGEFDPDESHLYLKEDGSITGAEIVSHPATLEWTREQGDYPRLLGRLIDAGCTVDDEYGLHIHVSRNAFKPPAGYDRSARACHQMTWLLFIYRNAESLVKLSRRDPSQWGSFDNLITTRRGAMTHIKQKAVRTPCSEPRYTAVNCNNERTFELRFFASTLDSTEFHAALEFADASVRYTRDLKSYDILRNGGLSWEAFTEWTVAHNYPHLTAEITGGIA